MELDRYAKTRMISFGVLHAIFLLGIAECMVLMTDPAGFGAGSGIQALMAAKPKDVKLVVILWALVTMITLVAIRKKVYVHDAEGDRYCWEKPVLKKGVLWVLLVVLPQLLVGAYVDLYYFFGRRASVLGLVMYAVKLICTGYVLYVLLRDRGTGKQ